jgi:hypothetical protein
MAFTTTIFIFVNNLLRVDRPANLHRENHLVLRLCNANDRGILRKAQTELNNMTSPNVGLESKMRNTHRE